MASNGDLSLVINPLVASQILVAHFNKQRSREIADVAIFKVSLFTQVAGVLLRLPQEIIAISIILLQRHITALLDDNDSLWDDSYRPDSAPSLMSAACIFLAAKQSFYPLTPRSVVNVYALLTSSTTSLLRFVNSSATDLLALTHTPAVKDHFASEGTYQVRRGHLFAKEKQILASLGFNSKVCLPYNLALTYLQALSGSSQELSARVLGHLNGALLSPQLLYLTHQPNALAVAAIYLAAREVEVPLVDEEVPWWEVFDVGREELGFLVLSMSSLQGFFDNNNCPTRIS